MRKLNFWVFFSSILMFVLLVAAFYFVDLSKHYNIRYDIFTEGVLTGHQTVDRFDTEGMVIYKAYRENQVKPGYPSVRHTVKLDKIQNLKTESLDYVVEGLKGAQKSINFRNLPGKDFNYLFFDPPFYYPQQKGAVEISSEPIFIPRELVSYMCLIDMYDFWKKGLQSMSVIVFCRDGRIPAIKSKIDVSYLRDKHLTVMGYRVPVEVYNVSIKGDNLAKMYLEKYSNKLLALELRSLDETFKATGYTENPLEKVRHFFNVVMSPFIKRGDIAFSELEDPQSIITSGIFLMPEESFTEKEIFFKSQRIILSGDLSFPKREGTLPVAIIVPPEGLFMRGHGFFTEALTTELLDAGFAVMSYSSPGQGKSQMGFTSSSDFSKVMDVQSAANFLLNDQNYFDAGTIHLIAQDSSTYLAARAASEGVHTGISSIILFNAPLRQHTGVSKTDLKNEYNRFLEEDRKEEIVSSSLEKIRAFENSVRESRHDFSFFMGKKLPVLEYRDFLQRDNFNVIKKNRTPIMMVYGRNSTNYDREVLSSLRSHFSSGRIVSRLIVLRRLGGYMGEVRISEGTYEYVLNNDVRTSIVNWMNEEFDDFGAVPTESED